MSTDQTPALARATEHVKVAMLGTTDGDLIDPDSDVPAGEMFRLAAEALPGAVSAALHDPDDPDWLMNVIADVPLRQGSIPQCEAVILADAVRAAILGGDQ